MSTSDPQDRPAPDEPVTPSSEPVVPATEPKAAPALPTEAPGTATTAGEGVRPADVPPVREGLTVTDDTVADDTAHKHAQARPLPTPPEPEPVPDRRMPAPRFSAARAERTALTPPASTPPATTPLATTPLATSSPAPTTPGTASLPTAGAPSTTAPSTAPATAPGTAPATPGPALAAAAATGATTATPLATPATAGTRTTAASATDPEDATLFPDPNAPRSIGAGTHVLGLVVGLLLPAIAALVTLLGVSRILSVEADGWAARVEVLGIVLVALGALLLGAVVLLSLWTPWVGYTGGLVLTLTGAVALFAPGVARTAMLHVVSAEGWQPTVVQTSVAATSGTLLVIGVLVLASGIVSHLARRHGLRLGAFRERNSH